MGTTSLAQPKMATDQIENLIFALGNPLLDISAPVDEAWLTKYNLKANDAILAAEEHDALFEELAQEDAVTYTAGGATMNSIRVAQYYLDNPRATTFVGCVGSDDNASKLSGAAAADSVRVEYLVDDTTPTGMCACVITGKNRSLVAKLAAANNYKASHMQSEPIWELATQAQIYYSAGFHLTVCPEAMLDLARHAAETQKTYAFNLSAPFLIQFFKDPMNQVIPYADFIFSNEDEAATYAKENGFDETEDLSKIALALAALDKVNASRPAWSSSPAARRPPLSPTRASSTPTPSTSSTPLSSSTPTVPVTPLSAAFWPASQRATPSQTASRLATLLLP